MASATLMGLCIHIVFFWVCVSTMVVNLMPRCKALELATTQIRYIMRIDKWGNGEMGGNGGKWAEEKWALTEKRGKMGEGKWGWTRKCWENVM